MSEDERLRGDEPETEAAEIDDAEEADVEAHGKGGSTSSGGFSTEPVPKETV